jgi:hypothetical protein
MGFLTFNPFKRERQNFPGVVIPLSEAPLRSHITANPEKENKDDSSIDQPKPLDRAPSAENGSAGSLTESSHLTIEALRAEIDAESSTSGQDSMYDSMCPPVKFPVSSQTRQFLALSRTKDSK